MSVKRYSGRATITLRLDDRDNYHYSVSVGGKSRAKGIVRPPASGFGRGIAYDSAKAFDETAQAALSFAIDDNSDIADDVQYDDRGTGYHITRRKPSRSAASNGRRAMRSMRNGTAYAVRSVSGGYARYDASGDYLGTTGAPHANDLDLRSAPERVRSKIRMDAMRRGVRR